LTDDKLRCGGILGTSRMEHTERPSSVPMSKLLSTTPARRTSLKLYACRFGRVQRLIQTQLVRTQALRRRSGRNSLSYSVSKVRSSPGSPPLASASIIDQYQDLASAKVVDKVEGWRAEVEEFNPRRRIRTAPAVGRWPADRGHHPAGGCC